MRVTLSEVWNFADIIKNDEKGWSFALHAGNAVVDSISKETLQQLRDDNDFNTELLPEIFTFRDILWQPDVFIEATQSLPSLRVLQAYCEGQARVNEETGGELGNIYAELLRMLGKETGNAVEQLGKENPNVTNVLGTLRKNTFPIIKFFIVHPRNRLDYYRDAVNRLNYAVKVIITEFNGKYTDLQDPFWEVLYDKHKTSHAEDKAVQPKGKERIEKEG
ncbi:hypothetical protein [Marinoscillum sp. MHG1-6]|uniref:hypothetical protein n=1 Tax=Marinoscillum sp. MHG1-6 TaxID=2959627 RepID=UPI0021580716|nr:hypothetical protein [Marinoscillum sp. MHG1-6]